MTKLRQAKKHAHSPEIISRAFRRIRDDKTDLFVYGTLMNDKYVQLLLKRKVKWIPAKLHHFMRIAPAWSFPLIVKHRGAITFGRILRDITLEELAILDRFENEGVLYRRQVVVVRVEDYR